jgi:hypothetical protein
MSDAEFTFTSMNTHQSFIIVGDTRILGCAADSLQERRFDSISPTDYKDMKASYFARRPYGSLMVVVGKGKERLRGNAAGSVDCRCRIVPVRSNTKAIDKVYIWNKEC